MQVLQIMIGHLTCLFVLVPTPELDPDDVSHTRTEHLSVRHVLCTKIMLTSNKYNSEVVTQ
jgi:hypothetical protein